MSYSDFLDTLIEPVRLFVRSLTQVANNLISNYFFITILGSVIFVSLVLWLYDLILDFIHKKRSDLDDLINRKQAYSLNQDVSISYYYRNYYKIFGFKFNKYRMQQLIKYSHLIIYKSDELNYAYRRLLINKTTDNHYLIKNRDFETENSKLRYDLFNDMVYDYREKNLNKVIRNKVQNLNLNVLAESMFLKSKTKFNKEPKWFGKRIDKVEPTSDEKKEMDNIIKNF